MSRTMILKCSCQSSVQNEMHGSGMRVHNEITDTRTTNNWRCTVCSRER